MKKKWSVKEIIKGWLKREGYDGLSNLPLACGCDINDLMPCGYEVERNCVAGHKELQNDGDWLMFPGKGEGISPRQ